MPSQGWVQGIMDHKCQKLRQPFSRPLVWMTVRLQNSGSQPLRGWIWWIVCILDSLVRCLQITYDPHHFLPLVPFHLLRDAITFSDLRFSILNTNVPRPFSSLVYLLRTLSSL